jgi:hypothetical protein
MSPLLGYKTQATDTSIEIELLLVQRWRQFTLTQKVEIITGLNKGYRRQPFGTKQRSQPFLLAKFQIATDNLN